MLGIRDLLAETKIILLLPDRKRATVSKGHNLYPRFLTYMDGDFSDVAAVLQKMVSINSRLPIRW